MKELLHAITDANEIHEVWNLHCKAMAEFGFDRLLYGFTRYRSGRSVGDPDDMLVLTNHPQNYAEAIFQNARFIRGPMAQWALDHIGVRSWSYMNEKAHRGELTDDEKELMAFNASMDVKAGYTISFTSHSDRFRAAIALVAEKGLTQKEVDQRWREVGDNVYLINKVMHLQCTTLPRDNAKPLTRRQQEVLDWIGDGKSIADVGILLGLTPATIEKHLRLAREALNAETTAQAILKRAFQNQVFMVS